MLKTTLARQGRRARVAKPLILTSNRNSSGGDFGFRGLSRLECGTGRREFGFRFRQQRLELRPPVSCGKNELGDLFDRQVQPASTTASVAQAVFQDNGENVVPVDRRARKKAPCVSLVQFERGDA